MTRLRCSVVVLGFAAFAAFACSEDPKVAPDDAGGGGAIAESGGAKSSGGARSSGGRTAESGGKSSAGTGGQGAGAGGKAAGAGGRAAGAGGARPGTGGRVTGGTAGVAGAGGAAGTGGADPADAGADASMACVTYCKCMTTNCADNVFPTGCLKECAAGTKWDMECRQNMCSLVPAQPANNHCTHAFGVNECLDKP